MLDWSRGGKTPGNRVRTSMRIVLNPHQLSQDVSTALLNVQQRFPALALGVVMDVTEGVIDLVAKDAFSVMRQMVELRIAKSAEGAERRHPYAPEVRRCDVEERV